MQFQPWPASVSLYRNKPPLNTLLAIGSTLLITTAIALSAVGEEQDRRLERWKKSYEEKILPIIRDRCLSCHNAEKAEGEFDLSKFADGNAAADAGDAWERVARRVRLNEMPPERSPGLNDEQKGSFHRWVDSRPGQDLCKQLASEETQSWYRGFVMSRRLTATEYTNAIQDLVGLPLLPGEEPPSDGAGGEGFDTVGDSLFTSTIHLETYLKVADRLIDAALPDGTPADETQQDISDRFLVVRPKSVDEKSELTDTDAARQIIASFARRAWRRPVDEIELARLLSLYEAATQRGAPFTSAIRDPLKAVLVSPHFLFVVETDPGVSGVQRLTPHQLAMRLSLFIWSSIPDDALLAKADSGEIYDDEVIKAEIRRMLHDDRARALGENFGLQWLGLRGFNEVRPDPEVFPQYNAELAGDMREEAILFVANVFRDDRPVNDLIAADYTYVNGRLAEHYDLANEGLTLASESDWKKVSLTNKRRGGVATLASVLTSSSYPRRTSPVLRGRWLLEELLGSAVPPPPPNVPALEESTAADDSLTLRQRLELHRQKAECASCHNRMDPLGFGLENFDGIGRWRELDNDHPVDATGTLPSGETFHGPEELKAVLMGRSDEFQKHFVRKLLGFALGRELNKFDECIVEESLKQLRDNELRSSILIEQIALSYPFQYRYHKQVEPHPPSRAKQLINGVREILKKAEKNDE
jgi:hypothetical protein